MTEIVDKKVGIPESITINGITYSVKETPELQQFIQSVSKVEKSKLYTQFESLRNQIANLGKVKIEDGGNGLDDIIEKLKGTFVTKEDLKQDLQSVVKEVVQPVLTATEQTRKNELQSYREKLIKDNEATCIPELVKGDTKDELDASLKESIRIRSAYPSPNTVHQEQTAKVTDPVIETQFKEMGLGATPTPPAQQAAQQTVQQTPPTAPRVPAMEVSGNDGVKSMSMKEFGEQRESLMRSLTNMYGEGTL